MAPLEMDYDETDERYREELLNFDGKCKLTSLAGSFLPAPMK